MEIRFVTRSAEAEAPESLKDLIEKKLFKIERFFNRISDVQIVLDYKRGMYIVEITANAGSIVMRGEDYSPDMRKAFEKALKNIERQVMRHKDRVQDHHHASAKRLDMDAV